MMDLVVVQYQNQKWKIKIHVPTRRRRKYKEERTLGVTRTPREDKERVLDGDQIFDPDKGELLRTKCGTNLIY